MPNKTAGKSRRPPVKRAPAVKLPASSREPEPAVPRAGWSSEQGEQALECIAAWRRERQKLCRFAETALGIAERMWERMEEKSALADGEPTTEGNCGVLGMFQPVLISRLVEEQLMQIEVLICAMNNCLRALSATMHDGQPWPALLAQCYPDDSSFYPARFARDLADKQAAVQRLCTILLHPPAASSSGTALDDQTAAIAALNRDEILLCQLADFAEAAASN